MVTIETFRQLALSFEEATEKPHFEKNSFRIKNKIFATVDTLHQRAVLKLSAIEQSVFCSLDKTIIRPVEGAWGKLGWTIIELKKIKKQILIDALTRAYCGTAPKKLAEKYRQC